MSSRGKTTPIIFPSILLSLLNCNHLNGLFLLDESFHDFTTSGYTPEGLYEYRLMGLEKHLLLLNEHWNAIKDSNGIISEQVK